METQSDDMHAQFGLLFHVATKNPSAVFVDTELCNLSIHIYYEYMYVYNWKKIIAVKYSSMRNIFIVAL